MELSHAAFESLVAEALERIPEEFRPYLENVEILVEEEPERGVLGELHVRRGDTLFGLYTGTPLPERTHGHPGFPDRITLFRRPLMEECESLEELRAQVVTTVLHEVAHHFGIGEARLKELGWG